MQTMQTTFTAEELKVAMKEYLNEEINGGQLNENASLEERESMRYGRPKCRKGGFSFVSSTSRKIYIPIISVIREAGEWDA